MAQLLDETERDRGHAVLRVDQQVGADLEHDAGRQAHGQHFLVVSGQRPNVALGVLDLFQDAPRAFQQELAGLRQDDAARMAQQKLGLQILLELPDLQAQGGLRDIKLLGGLGDVPDFGDPDEIAELAEIDRGLPGVSS